MSNTLDEAGRDAVSWDVYWQGMQKNPEHKRGGTQEPVLEQLWLSLFSEHLSGKKMPRCLELACGSGAVSLHAAVVEPTARLTCSDVSVSALTVARESLSGVSFIACDASRLPFPKGTFDLVFSQFGVEYAGIPALAEAATMVAPGGHLALVVHLRNGAIYEDYERNLAAIQAIGDCHFMALAHHAFSAGFNLQEGVGTVAAFRSAQQDFQPAVRALESLFRHSGDTVADGLPKQLYRDVAHMFPNLRSYQRQDIMSWLGGFNRELDAYQGRLESMLGSALDQADVDSVLKDFEGLGLREIRKDVVELGNPVKPSGWFLVLERIAS